MLPAKLCQPSSPRGQNGRCSLAGNFFGHHGNSKILFFLDPYYNSRVKQLRMFNFFLPFVIRILTQCLYCWMSLLFQSELVFFPGLRLQILKQHWLISFKITRCIGSPLYHKCWWEWVPLSIMLCQFFCKAKTGYAILPSRK